MENIEKRKILNAFVKIKIFFFVWGLEAVLLYTCFYSELIFYAEADKNKFDYLHLFMVNWWSIVVCKLDLSIENYVLNDVPRNTFCQPGQADIFSRRHCAGPVKVLV